MNKRVIALVDWYWGGHHADYFVNYAVTIAKGGYRVLPLCSDPGDFTRRLAVVLSENDNVNLATSITEPLKLDHPRPSKIRPARYRGLHKAWHRFGKLGKRLRKWESSEGEKIENVFFSCIYDQDFEYFRKVEKIFGFPWSGLYLNSRSFRIHGTRMPYTTVMPCPEKIFSSELMRSAAVLDEGAVAPMGKIAGGKPIVLMPDFTNAYLPNPRDEESGLANKILNFAQRRPVISLMGHLTSTKRIEEFTAARQHESMRDVFFFLGGEVTWSELGESLRIEMNKVWGNAGNVFAHLCSLTDAQINAVMSISDVIYAAYRDFPNSSNILTKTAFLKKPIIVSDGYVMAERVREYELGEVVTEGNVDKIVETINSMLVDGYADELNARARWEDYQAVHSRDRLPKCFEQLLS